MTVQVKCTDSTQEFITLDTVNLYVIIFLSNKDFFQLQTLRDFFSHLLPIVQIILTWYNMSEVHDAITM